MLEPYLSLSPKLNDVPKESFIFLWEDSSKMESQKQAFYTKQKKKKRIQNIEVCNHHSNQMNIQHRIQKWVHCEKVPH